MRMVIQYIIMPKLGESVTEGTLERWLVQPGDFVKKYEALAEVITDKVNAEIPSSYTGVIKELLVQEGETLSVGGVICSMETDVSQEFSGKPEQSELQQVEGSIVKDFDQLQQMNAMATRTEQLDEVVTANKSTHKMRYSPAVLKIAQEYQISLQDVVGTGLDGRITRKDLRKIIAQGTISTNSLQQAEKTNEMIHKITRDVLSESLQSQNAIIQPIPNNVSQSQAATGDIEIPVSNIRNAIAKHTLRSTQEIPHAWTMIEVDVTDLVAYRHAIKNKFEEREGFPLTYFAFFVKAIAQALKEFPMMNSIWAGDKIIQKKNINISIAVSTDDALFTPVIKQVDEKSIKGIAQEIYVLSKKARSHTLRLEDVQGGTFSVNNTGSFGSIQSKGIINYPQAAILQVEKIVKRPVILNGGMFAARDIVNLCLSLDHRILDGLICGNFLDRVKNILENTEYNENIVY